MSAATTASTVLPAGVSLASLLGCQATSQPHQPTPSPIIAAFIQASSQTKNNSRHEPASSNSSVASSTNKRTKKGTAAAASAHAVDSATSTLPIPFTHTVVSSSLLSSILRTPVAARGSVSTSSTSLSPTSTLHSALDHTQQLLAQLLPIQAQDTLPPTEFNKLFVKYVEACAGDNLQRASSIASSASDSSASKEKKRKRTEESAAPSSSSLSSCLTAIISPHALHSVSPTVVGLLAARCMELLAATTPDTTFDSSLLQSPHSYWSALYALVRSDSLSARFTPGLFALLSRHDALPLLEAALVHLHDATERELVDVARYALDQLPTPTVTDQTVELDIDGRASDASKTQSKKRRKKSARSTVVKAYELSEPVKIVQVPGGPFAVIIDLLLTSPVSVNFLRHSLSVLSPSQSHKLLHYLYAWTLRYWFHTESEVHAAMQQMNKNEKSVASNSSSSTPSKPSSSLRIPSFTQVVNWMNILLDAVDFMRLYEKEEAKKEKAESSSGASSTTNHSLPLLDLVTSLASHISHHHLQFLERSQDLKGFVAIFQHIKRTPNAIPLPQAPIVDYSVELLELGV